MKKIGIILAMKEELEALISKLEIAKEHKIYDLTVFECNYKNNTCYLVESGIGKVNAARSTQLLISNFSVDCILNVGVAGSISKDVRKCDIVIADKLVQHDYDITAFNHEKGYIPNIGVYIPCDNTLVELCKTIKMDTNVLVGTVSSGDIFVTEESMAKKINTKFGAVCVEMEGAAIVQVCYLCKVPFIVIRSISDSIYEENNKMAYDDFLELSSNMVSDFVIKLLNKIQ